jgi:outer membrane receptor protein involved in Fe transport
MNTILHRIYVAFVLTTAFLLLVVTCPKEATAQGSTASINGTVHDSSGGVVPDVEVTLTNTQTNVERRGATNAAGVYVFLNIVPGEYRLQTSKTGFKTSRMTAFTLAVNQTATFDFTLDVGEVTQEITVEGSVVELQSSTAELGAVVERQQVLDLPLNGRNFTQLLSLTPGVSPVSVGQNADGFFAINTAGSSFTFPSINGQTNRSNFYMLDGVNNQGNFVGTYGVPPIIDTIQEFKVQSHNDQAEFGGALGGIINVASKSGTNEFHGTVWEFLRNDVLDARNTFLLDKTPFRQNQFGVAGGGPVIIPKLYDGRNKTFFYAGYQGFRYRRPADSLLRVPTEANLRGDFSDDPRQIYNPWSTRPDPNNPGQFIRDPFPNNQIPQGLIDPGIVLFAQTLLPKPTFTGVAGKNAKDGTPFKQNQTDWTVKVDQVLGANNAVWFRYSHLGQSTDSSGGLPSLASLGENNGMNLGVSYVHTFSPSTILQVQYGRVLLKFDTNARFRDIPPDFDKQVGFAETFSRNWYGYGGALIPDFNVENWFSGGEINSINNAVSDIHQVKANVSKIRGNHTFKWGGELSSNGWDSLYNNAHSGFSTPQTANPSNPSGTGSELASFLLNVPDNATKYNSHETMRWGGETGFYFQDQWKATQKLTVNLGLRWDLTIRQPFGTPGQPGDENRGLDTGDYDFSRGVYLLQNKTPFCSERGHYPCIPGDKLPDHVEFEPRGKIYHNQYDNWQPRFGLAYRLNQETVLRASFGMFFENWGGVTQTSENYVGTWPDVGIQIANNLNNQLNQSATPDRTGTNPFPSGVEGLFPAPTPFEQVTWFMDPFIKNAYSMQWNLGVQRQLNTSTVVTANYVGSGSRRTNLGGYYNVALTPGPGNPRDRQPFPYAGPTYYDRSWGRSNYHSFQLLLDKKFTKGLAYMVSYTWSKSIDIGSSGWFGVEGQSVQDPYHFNNDRSVSGFDLTHVLTINGVYQLPIGPGKQFASNNSVLNHIVGNWQLNAIALFRSGIPYNLKVPGDLANTGNNGYLRPDYIGGDARLSNPTPDRWFNTSAFAVPASFTFGNFGRYVLRSDGVANFDFSIFRQFPIREGMRFEFRAEMFNAFNSPVYSAPDGNLLSSTFGQVTSTANQARQVQLALKFIF